MDKKEIIIEMLRFGKSKNFASPNGFTEDELKNHLRGLGFQLNEYEMQDYAYTLGTCFFKNTLSPITYKLSLKSYFDLIDYEELQHAYNVGDNARKEAVKANNWSTFAMVISILSLILSTVFSVVQINSTTEIKNEQLQQLINSNAAVSQNILQLQKTIEEKKFELPPPDGTSESHK